MVLRLEKQLNRLWLSHTVGAHTADMPRHSYKNES